MAPTSEEIMFLFLPSIFSCVAFYCRVRVYLRILLVENVALFFGFSVVLPPGFWFGLYLWSWSMVGHRVDFLGVLVFVVSLFTLVRPRNTIFAS